ncbi:HD domain-containing protein [Deinococcus cellulosilyticus]|uniref:Phosphohydrolase n=1 Tax=Deinococcus cellulosilyticus (strain DSM 18568 / NBRC 106333 / KACC 11606 / 5516J-15) TaxID=1223518 RepID=A0A511NBA8_DEIC1|nr:HD domain-containing protein [Deinococcus cellulosilyticus]GEM49671.1 hypothetical protein DC3_53060 [Deinococcus cellulosilyticus NBRC 106333 = KACC 11606]
MMVSPALLTESFQIALDFAYRNHHTQTRKGPLPVPYLGHLLGVCSLVIEHGGNETEAIAALLHDTIEDVGEAAIPDIRRLFGDEVLDIVLGCTDASKEAKDRAQDVRADWLGRKERYLQGIPDKSASARLVALADKVYNARSIQEDYLDIGDAVWSRFTGGKWGTLWYYRALTEAFRKTSSDLHPRYQRLVKLLARTTQETERMLGVSDYGAGEFRQHFLRM